MAVKFGGDDRARANDQRVGQEVLDALESEEDVPVMIALAEPPSLQAKRLSLETLRAEIFPIQQGVLSPLGPSDFELRIRYEAVPALAGQLTAAGLSKLLANPSVVRIDLDVGGAGALAQSVTVIDADVWHGLGITGEGVVVAVLDTGLDTDHDDLADDLIHQECFLDFDGTINGIGRCANGSDRQSGAPAAESGLNHGVMTTGIITSRGVVSSVGVAPDAQIVSIKVLDDTPPAGTFLLFSEIVAALDFIINNRPDVDVINMSLGTFALFAGDCDNDTANNMAGAAAINTLRANGVITFASSDNDGSGTMMSSPACISSVVSVGATDNADNVAPFTNSNGSLDLMAPGVFITSTGLGNGAVAGSGTSFASPHAAGCAALLIQAGVAVTPDQIETRLETSPVVVTDPTNGLQFPRIDCFQPTDQFDSDGDTVLDINDNCPSWPNPLQNPPPWTVTLDGSDPDCDGFATADENFMGTLPQVACAANNVANDEGLPDAWPFDFNDNQRADLADVLGYIPVFNSFFPIAPYDPRWDLDASGGITLGDVLSYIPVFNLTCT
ncbi:MAG: S8 family serine peptidase [Chloroflexi bacterium]|nr:S8 family serine peptidase [Chloroflexota bacterium]